MTPNRSLAQWVDECAALCKPERIHWCDGSDEEKQRLLREAVHSGDLIELNQEVLPGGYLHRSAQNDVARTENLTFICSTRKEDAGPTNNWMAPKAMYSKLRVLCSCAMRGRTMYVVPYLMGPPEKADLPSCMACHNFATGLQTGQPLDFSFALQEAYPINTGALRTQRRTLAMKTGIRVPPTRGRTRVLKVDRQ